MFKQLIHFVGLIVLLLLLIFIYLYFFPQKNYLTVSEVLEKQEELKDQRVTVRGHVQGLAIAQTVQGCYTRTITIKPNGTREYGERQEFPGCSCNKSWARSFFLIDSENIDAFNGTVVPEEKTLEVQAMDCHADDCTMTCTPINPFSGYEYEFSGILKQTGSRLELIEVKIETARQNVNDTWEPIPTKTFTLPLN